MTKIDTPPSFNTPSGPTTPGQKDADLDQVNAFHEHMQGNPNPTEDAPTEQSLPPPHRFEVDTSKIFAALAPIKPDPTEGEKTPTNDGVPKDPPKPPIPNPDKEEPWSFWKEAGKTIDKFTSNVKKAVDQSVKDVVDFLGSPDLATFAKVANIVFAGGLVVAAGVLAATGVGAPASIALLAIAGGAGLIMQAPAIQEKIQAGVVAIMTPVIGQVNAEKLGPLVTQGVIAGAMIGILVSGGNAGSVQAVIDSTVGVFRAMSDVFNGIGQVYTAAEPFLQIAGINVNQQDIMALGSLFASMASIVPSISSYTESIGQPFTEFFKNPGVDKFLEFLKTTTTGIPDDILKLIDSNFLNNIGSVVQMTEALLKEFSVSNVVKFLNDSSKMLPA